MFVSEGARDRLATRRRAAFYDDVLDPALAEARSLGIPLADIIRHIEEDR